MDRELRFQPIISMRWSRLRFSVSSQASLQNTCESLSSTAGVMFHTLIDITYVITYLCRRGKYMTILNVTEARSKLYNLIDETAITHQPITIKGKRSNAVLVSEEDWNAISETLYLLSVSNMRESIKNGLKESIESCSKELDW